MKQQIVLDLGNTIMKLALFNNDQLQFVNRYAYDEIDKLHVELERHDANIIVSSVISDEQLDPILIKNHSFYLLKNLQLPFKNKYATPNTLGKDRIALAAAAVSEFKNKNTLVLDIGTCLTYEMVTETSEYLGGAISPGMQMRFKSLNRFTEGLPLINSKKPVDLIGNTTETNILSGVINGMKEEMDGTINTYKARFSKLNVVLTGGDQVFFAECLKNNFFARPEFLLKGLNFIAELNA